MIELLLSDSRAMAQDVLAWAVCIAALVWGGGPERAVAIVWLVFFELVPGGYALATDGGFKLDGVAPLYATIDFVAVVCWVGIALYANRNYTLWIAAMQVLAITAHLARGLVEAISSVAYVTMVSVPGWFQLLLLAVGLIRHIYRKRRYGEYRDWRLSSPPTSISAKAQEMPNELGLQKSPHPTWRDDLK